MLVVKLGLEEAKSRLFETIPEFWDHLGPTSWIQDLGTRPEGGNKWSTQDTGFETKKIVTRCSKCLNSFTRTCMDRFRTWKVNVITRNELGPTWVFLCHGSLQLCHFFEPSSPQLLLQMSYLLQRSSIEQSHTYLWASGSIFWYTAWKCYDWKRGFQVWTSLCSLPILATVALKSVSLFLQLASLRNNQLNSKHSTFCLNFIIASSRFKRSPMSLSHFPSSCFSLFILSKCGIMHCGKRIRIGTFFTFWVPIFVVLGKFTQRMSIS